MIRQVSRVAASLFASIFVLAFSVVAQALDPAFADPDAAPPGGSASTPASRRASHEILVRFRPGVALANRELLLRGNVPGLKQIRTLRQPGTQLHRAGANSVFTDLVVVELADMVEARRTLAWLGSRSEVAYAEPNTVVRLFESPPRKLPNDFEFGAQWGLLNSGQGEGVAGNDIHAPEAWQVVSRAPQVRVAVIDTGIDYFHPDLEANLWTNSGEIPGNGLDDDRNGYVDDVHGYDFVSDDGDPMDDQSHGSHVAGIIGAVGDNRIGVTGVCWETRLMAIKSFDDHGESTVDSVIQALHYAAANGAQIINASWGQTDKSRSLQDAITEVWNSGVVIIAAAGNERTDVAPFPAAYEPVVAVAAINNRAQRALFSNYGAFVDLSAPGESILSTTPNGRYDFLSGTSMATPHVVGVAALVLARHPEFTPTQVADVLRNSVDEIQTDQYVGTGRLNAWKAVNVRNPLPLARLRLPKVISGRLDLNGTAAGPEFAGFRLEFGIGTYPTNWTPFHTSTTAVADGPLLRDFNSSMLGEGTHSVRLVVTDLAGQEAQDRAVVAVRNVQITSPMNNDVFRAGEKMIIRGTVFGPGRTYTLEHGLGVEPRTWTDAGIELSGGGGGEPFNAELATWDTGLAATNEFHTLRLTARTNGVVVGEWLARLIYLDGRLRPGWPVHLPSTGLYPTNDWRHLTVADLDGDGRQEILRVSPGSPPGAPAQLLVFAPDGALRWSQELDAGEPSSDIPVVGDLDGDGRQEVLVDAGEHRKLFAFRADGTPFGAPYPLTLPVPAPGKVLADLDHDGRLELICLGNTWGSADHQFGQLVVLDAATGQVRASWRADFCWGLSGWPRRFPAVGNFDRDRDLEIVAPVGCGQIGLFDLKDPERAVWTRPVQGEILASPVVADFDHDGRDEVLVACNDPAALDGRGMSGGLYLFDGFGNIRSGWPVLVESSFATAPALADFDGDGRLEIAVVDVGRGMLHLLRSDGFDAPGWPVSLGPVKTIRAAATIGDLDGDAVPDIVMAVPGLLLPFLYSGDPATAGGLRAWRYDASPINLSGHAEYPALFMECATGAGRIKAPQVTLTDLDGNGLLDIVTSSIDDAAFSPQSPVSARKDRHTLHVWEIGVPFDATAAAWPMFQHDAHRSGYLESPEATNRPPVIENMPSQTIRQGGSFFPIVLDRYVEDPDHSASQLKWTVTGQLGLQVTISNRRVLTVTQPGPAWTGTETLRLVAEDPEGAQATTTVAYSARADYTPPVARDDTAFTNEDEAVEIAVLANDSHPLGLPLKIEQVSRPLHGRVQVKPDGLLRYTPSGDFHGEDSFTYLVTDGQGGMALATATVEILPVPDAPIAEPDRVTLDEDTPADIDVLANDTDADADALRLLQFTQPAKGSVVATPAGTLLYVPPTNWFGTDSFDYTIADSTGLTSTGAVQIAVRPLNDPPFTADQTLVLNRNLNTDVFYDASDPEGAPLTFEILDGPKHGDLWKYPNIATYYPEKGFAGSDAFTYVASDGSLTSRVTTVSLVVLDVNNPPRTEAMHVATRVNRPLTFSLSATDADNDALTFNFAREPLHGRLATAGTNFLYTPNPDFLGEDGFSFRASDGRDVSPETAVTITVTDKNTAPSAKDSSVEVKSNTPTQLYLAATDGEGDPLSFVILTNPVAGQLSGEAPALIYTPSLDYSGPDRFSFRASDGELESEPATVTLNVVPKNRRPIAKNQTLNILPGESAAVSFDLNDSDGDSLRIAILKGPRLGRISGTGTNFIYVPKPGMSGYDYFTYKAWDGHIYSETVTVTVRIEAPPPPPAPRFENIRLAENGAVQLQIKTETAGELHVQSSTNLTEWTTFRVIRPSTEHVEVVHANAPASVQVFYRAIRK